MENPQEGKQIHDQSRAICLKLPGVQIILPGPLSVVALLILLAVMGGVFYLVITRSGPGVWVSFVLWLVFIGYWSALAKNAAPTSSSEPAGSRQLHQLLMYGALLLASFQCPA